MTRDDASQTGLISVVASVSHSIWWDARQNVLVFESSTSAKRPSRLAVCLDDLHSFHQDVRSSDARKVIIEAVGSLSEQHLCDLPAHCRSGVGRFAFLLLRCGMLEQDGELEDCAKRLLSLLGPDTPDTAWHILFEGSLDYQRRYRLLELVHSSLSDRFGREPQSDLNPVDVGLIEPYWWTSRCLYDLSREWYATAGPSDVAAREALWKCSLMYLSVLKDEPRAQALERFLAECGTNSEREVHRVLMPARRNDRSRESGDLAALRGDLTESVITGADRRRPHWEKRTSLAHVLVRDEVIRRTFVIWSLKRYNLQMAWGLSTAGISGVSRRLEPESFVLAVFLGLLVLLVSRDTLSDPSMSYHVFRGVLIPVMAVQTMLQCLALFVMAVGSPALFRLLTQRSVFGSLLAWITILLPIMLGAPSLDIGSEKLGNVLHRFLISGWQHIAVVVVLTLSLALVFIANELTNHVYNRSRVLSRAVVVLCVMLAGAVFWSVLFAPMVKFLLEDKSLECGESVAAIGSAFAVLFSILAQLLWADKSMTEPRGDPL